MTHGGEWRVVGHAVGVEPPTAEHGSHEGGEDAADVDEYVEYLEAGVALRAVFGIVVELTDDGLEVALEETVAEGDEEERDAGYCEEPGGVALGGENGYGKNHVAKGHDEEARDDSTLVVAGLVGNVSAHEAENVDAGIEEWVDECARLFIEAELGAKEQDENGVHDVVAESFAHVAQGRRYQALGMVLEHNDWYKDLVLIRCKFTIKECFCK